jgi:hypothetical protein
MASAFIPCLLHLFQVPQTHECIRLLPVIQDLDHHLEQ